jgi:hypothetical protein
MARYLSSSFIILLNDYLVSIKIEIASSVPGSAVWKFLDGVTELVGSGSP